MINIKQFIIIIILLPTVACEQKRNKEFNYLIKNDSALKMFSVKWKIDSIGLNGYRTDHYRFEKSTQTWLINEMNLVGYSKENIVALLGNPNNSGLGREDNRLIFEYKVNKDSSASNDYLMIYFDGNNQLHQITKYSE